MAWRFSVAPLAIADLEDIYLYIGRNTGPLAAERVLAGIEKQIAGLPMFPERGNIPKELAAVGRTDYRELHFKPYRIFYRLNGTLVEVVAVLDGRRDMATLLRQRLIR